MSPAQPPGRRVCRGAFLVPKSDSQAVFIKDGIALLDGEGVLVDFGPTAQVSARLQIDLGSVPACEGLFLPPFYDIHFHWVQDQVREMPKASLLEWLENYAFPTEGKFADPEYAAEKAAQFWKRIHATGTVGGLCYSSIHSTALEAAMREAPSRFRIGNSLFTRDCPDDFKRTESESCASVSEGIQAYGERYVVTPRFAPVVGPDVMKFGAKAANEKGCFQQTHLSETTEEVELVINRFRESPGFEDIQTYTDVYDRCGMLGPKSVFGHCIHLTPPEWDRLAETESVIASCPTSNAPIDELGLGSGLFDFRAAEAHGVRWGLASDIGGGPFLSMFDVMRSFVEQNARAGVEGATWVKALYRATIGNAAILGMGAAEAFAVGSPFDTIRVAVEPSDFRSGDPEKILRSIVDSAGGRVAFDSLVLETIVDGSSSYHAPGTPIALAPL